MAHYWTLFTRTDGIWHPQFGDYERDVVVAEKEEYRSEYAAKDIKIVRHDDDEQADAHTGIFQGRVG